MSVQANVQASPQASPQARTRRAERSGAARAAMLDTAIGLLATRGYSGMKLADVSRGSGYSYGLAPFHFESKAGLLRAIQEEIDASYTDHMAAACDPDIPGREFVDRWVTATFAFAKGHPAHWRASVVILVESVLGVPDVAVEHSRFASRNIETLRTAFERGRRDGSIPASVDPPAAAATVAALMKGINFEWFGDPTVDLDASCRLVLDVVRQVLRP
ncbi:MULTISPECIES: TetR/AcrR family transcriptional regulator [unclassified Frankia]|uniref:TetR/AcrR family transcriptional regulator n=1 Tax=unclassified Frankia TaxID=2632575 RepID=UPI002AD280A1|nr:MULTISPECIES: TetR/AcrR family transcriptional regulator [unclassified Frankia]